jgi:environmental stress-induced protein Ves
VSRAFNGNQTAKTSKILNQNEDYNFMARGKTFIHEKRARSVLSNTSKSVY